MIMTNAALAPDINTINLAFDNYFYVSLIVSLPALSVAICSHFVPLLQFKFGEKKTLSLGLIFYLIAGTSGLWLTSLKFILVSRIILGIGLAIIMVVVNSLVGDSIQPSEKKVFLSQQSLFINVSSCLSVILSGFLSLYHWRLPFIIYIFTLPILLINLKIGRDAQHIQKKNAFVYSSEPKKNMLVYYFYGFFGMMIYYMAIVFLPTIIGKDLGYPSYITGFAMAILAFISAIFGKMLSYINQKVSANALICLIYILFSLGQISIAFLHNEIGVMGLILFFGIGFGWLFPTLIGEIHVHAQKSSLSRVTAVFMSCYFLGQFMTPFLTKVFISDNIFHLFFITGIISFIVPLSNTITTYLYIKNKPNKNYKHG